MYKIFLVLFLSSLAYAELINGVSIVVKGEIITLYDIKEQMRRSRVDVREARDILIRKKLEEAELEERKITVTSSDVYDDIKRLAKANGMSVSELYATVRESSGLSSTEFKEQTKEKLLAQKLYSAIAYSSVQTPSEEEIQEYYELHKEEFKHPASFEVTIYSSQNKALLEKKRNTPLYHSPAIKMQSKTLFYDTLPPQIAEILEKTKLHTFTPVIPTTGQEYATFYLQEVQKPQNIGYEEVKDKIINLLMGEKREQVLGDYFARLKNNADIKIIREAE